ncbi:MAG: transcription antitermination factor NusB [Nitrospinae bacterium]|nr:transcription antitermination factor NusB [Nitrospinota bacterium]
MIVENRKAGRELAFHILYHADRIGSLTPEEVERYWRLHPADEKSKIFADRLITLILEKNRQIDDLLTEASASWSLERMDAVSRSILRLGVCEIYFFPDVPPAVTMDEAIRLAKRYGPENAPGFVNGILDRLYQEKMAV